MSASPELRRRSTSLKSCRIENSARVGVSRFGAEITLGATNLECNLFDLDGEDNLAGQHAGFVDSRGNACGCAPTTKACAMTSANLAPPKAMQ